jgi:hypothetical protein
LQKSQIPEQKPMPRIRESDRHKQIFEIICLTCSAIILSLTAYSVVASILGHIDVVGATLVNVQFPSSNDVFSVKPVSVVMAAGLGLTYSGLELARPIMLKYSHSTYSYLTLFVFVGTALCGYEVMYNFAVWIGQLSAASIAGIFNPDILLNSFPNPSIPWNLVFATKLTTTILASGIYSLYFIHSLEKEKASLV